jgi:ribulose 1,5-bisphosphate synthetase/thiazole synthase
MDTRLIEEHAKEIPVIKDVDVVVVGGGPAGIGAAIAAAKNGAALF